MRLDRSNLLHPLVLSQHQAASTELARCCGCGEDVSSGESYSCLRCRIHLHKTCADSVSSDHLFHRNHCLQFLVDPPPDLKVACSCKFCSICCGGVSYYCSSCGYTIELKLTMSIEDAVGTSPDLDLQDTDHKHENSLIFNEVGCTRCGARVDPVPIRVNCEECPLHLGTKCFDLPKKIDHPCHRKHPLLLLAPSGRPLRKRICNVCENMCRGCTYSCRRCDFDAHTECVSPPPIARSEIHEHSFSLLLRTCEFTCDGCGKGANSAPYLCSQCNLLMHASCILLPRSIKILRHHHPLFHTFYLRKSGKKTWECQLCFNMVDPRRGSYNCSDSECDYVAHVGCVVEAIAPEQSTKKLTFKTTASASSEFASGSLQVSFPNKLLASQEALPQEVEKVNHHEYETIILEKEIEAETGTVLPIVIKHFSHKSYFVLCLCPERTPDGEPIELQCLGCVLPISPGSRFFCCRVGEYCLHRDCALLDQEMKHWNHPHLLHLNWGRVFTCSACKCESTGFSYSCRNCKIFICLLCKDIPDKFQHPGHKDMLFFDHNYKDHCGACGNLCGGTSLNGSPNYCAFRCKDCDFVVDFPCLTLPTTATHMYDEHPLTLTYHDQEDNPINWICHVCEDKRDPKHWFYRCEECKFKAHPKCVHGKYPYFRQGTGFRSPGHQHPVKAMTICDYPLCLRCGEVIEDMAFKCVEPDCEYIRHWECMSSEAEENASGNLAFATAGDNHHLVDYADQVKMIATGNQGLGTSPIRPVGHHRVVAAVASLALNYLFYLSLCLFLSFFLQKTGLWS